MMDYFLCSFSIEIWFICGRPYESEIVIKSKKERIGKKIKINFEMKTEKKDAAQRK